VEKLNVIILAADGPSNNQKDLPGCLQSLKGGNTLLDYQIRTLNLCGINSEDIIIIVGKEGAWEKEKAKQSLNKYKQKKIVVNKLNELTSSEESFLLGVEKLENKSPLIVINGDVLFDTHHIEQLIQVGNKNACFTKKAYFINEKGIQLEVKNNNIENIISKSVLSLFPWNIYCGLCLLSSDSLEKIITNKKRLGLKSFLHNIDYNVGINNFISLDYSNNSPRVFEESNKSIFLKGGSYANLVRKHIVRKQAKGEGTEKLKREIDWIKNLPDEISKYFPIVLEDYRDENNAWYDMPWYSNPTLRKNILTGVYDSRKSFDFLSSVLDLMFEKLYSQIINDSPEDTWIIKKHIFRVMQRLELSSKKSKVLKGMLIEKFIYINGDKFLNIPYALNQLLKFAGFFSKIKPKFLTLVHGDLHFQNIFVGPLENGNKFLLADPSGDIEGSDLFYDLGKIWHSINGLYDLIHTDLFYLKQEVNHSKLLFNFEFNNVDLIKTYKEIKNYLIRYLPTKERICLKEDWLLEVKFSETMHFCSVLPFHIVNDNEEKKAKALYLMATVLINNLLNELGYAKKNQSDELVKFCKFEDWLERILI